MHDTTKSFARLGRALAVSALFAAPNACDDSTGEKLKAAELAGGCSINSDCMDPFVCAFERCHVACTEDRDCAAGQRCVNGEQGTDVCQLPDETNCARDKDCRGEQICAIDLECRDPCSSSGDCVGDQTCVKTGECASTDSTRDVLDKDGNLLAAGVGPGGAGGTNGSGGANGTGASNGTGGTLGAGGANGTGGESGGSSHDGGSPDASSGDSGLPDASAGGGSGTDAGDAGLPPRDFVEPGDVETVDNNTWQNAVVAKHTASIYVNGTDQDWFSIQAPPGNGAHTIQVDIDQQPGARVIVGALDGVNRDVIGNGTTGAGALAHAYITVRAGTTTFLEFAPFGNNTGEHRVDLTFSTIPENDVHEPNDAKALAAPIALNTDVAAQCIRAHVTSTDAASDDWYKFDVAAGPVTLKLVTDLPLGPRMTIGWATAAGNAEKGLVTTPAATDTFAFDAATAGTYFLHFQSFGNTIPEFTLGALPENVKSQYVFQVQQ